MLSRLDVASVDTAYFFRGQKNYIPEETRLSQLNFSNGAEFLVNLINVAVTFIF